MNFDKILICIIILIGILYSFDIINTSNIENQEE